MLYLTSLCYVVQAMSCHVDFDLMPCTSFPSDMVRLSPTGPTVSVKPGNTKVRSVRCAEG